MGARRQSAPNSRSRDLDSKTREALAGEARAMRELGPSLLADLGIPPDGAARIVFAPDGAKRPGRMDLTVVGHASQACAADMVGKVCVLVACSHTKPGGGWLSGARAQEESVSRESTWAIQCALHPEWHAGSRDWMGPPGALVLDGAEIWSGSPRPVVLAGICAANRNACRSRDEWELRRSDRMEALASGVEAALREASRRSCSGAVLCAAGTGVFGWDPGEAMEAIESGAMRSGFKGPVVMAAGNEEGARRLMDAKSIRGIQKSRPPR